MKKLLSLLLMLLMVVTCLPVVSASEWNYTDPDDFGDYFFLHQIKGTVSDTTPVVTFNTTAEYYEFTMIMCVCHTHQLKN